MVKCIFIKNLFTKQEIKCNLDNITDIYKFLYDLFQYQPRNTIYLYKFDNDESYLTGHLTDDDSFLMEKLSNTAYDNIALTVIEYMCDNINNNDNNELNIRDKKLNSIVNSIEKIASQHNINEPIDKQKIKEFLCQLESDPYKSQIMNARDQYIAELKKKNKSDNKIQEGGIIIWLFEKYLIPSLPDMVQTIFAGLFEIIDIILMIAAAIPFAIAPPLVVVEVIIDVIALVWAILRFDIVGIVGSIVGFIPIIGGTFGIIIKVLGKVYKYMRKATKGVRKVVRGVKTGVRGVKTGVRGVKTGIRGVKGIKSMTKGKNVQTILEHAQNIAQYIPQEEEVEEEEQAN